MSAHQFSTFYVADRLYGINVSAVQEVTKALAITEVPLAPNFIHGLINLRGQIATAVGLHELFGLKSENSELMNVVCREDNMLISLLVDRIGDVVELDEKLFENTPDTVTDEVAKYMSGVYKISGELLSIIDVNKIINVLNE